MSQANLSYDTGTYNTDSGSHRITTAPYSFYQYYEFTPKKKITDFVCGAYFYVGAGRTIRISTIVLDSTRKLIYESPAVETKITTNTIPYFDSYAGKATYTLNPGTTYYVGFKLVVVSHDGTVEGGGNYVTPYFLNPPEVTKQSSESEWGTFTGEYGYTRIQSTNGASLGGTLNSSLSIYTPYKILFSVVNNLPTAPTSCSATGDFKPGGKVTLSTGGATDADGDLITYQFYYSTNGSSWLSAGSTTTDTLIYTIPSTITSSTIKFRVRSFDGYSYSYFVSSSDYTMNYNAVPTQPSTLSVEGSFRPGEMVTMRAGTSTDADGDTVYYHYQYTTDGGQSWTTIIAVDSAVRNFNLPSDISSTYIQFRVRGYDQKAYSAWTTSPEYTVKYNTAPTAPTSVFFTGNPTYVVKGTTPTLNAQSAWDADGDTLKIHVQYSLDDSNTWQEVGMFDRSFFFVEIPVDLEGKTIKYRARAYDGQAYSPYKESPTYTLNTMATITVTSPSNLVEVNEGDTITLSGSALDTDANQALMVYYVIGNSSEQIVTTGMSGTSGIEFTKNLRFSGNAIWDGETKVVENVVPNGVSGDVTLTMYAKDSAGAYSETVTRTMTMKPNQAPILTIDQTVVSMEEGTSFRVNYTIKDSDVDSTTLRGRIRGNATYFYANIDAKEEHSGYIVVKQEDSKISVGNTSITSERLVSGIYFLDITVEDEHGAVSDVKTITLNVTANRKPLITLNPAPKAIVVTDGTYQFSGTVSDLDTYDQDKLTLSVRDCGGEIVEIPFNEDGTFTYDYTFGDENVGLKTLVFIANDQKELSSVMHEFEIVDEKILFEFNNPVETDLGATKASLIFGYGISGNATFKVEICNNGFDETPTWEDCTQAIIDNTPYSFTNEEKTAEKWGINLRVEVVKNDAPQIYVDRIGILFE